MKLIDADLFKENIRSGLYVFCQENKEDICRAIDDEPTIERPQGKWFNFIDTGLLKARHSDYVLYKVDYLLDNLTREVYIMEDARRLRGKEE